MSSVERSSAIHALANQIRDLQKQAKAMGLHTGERDLLECTNCGLMEDIFADGRLVTYNKAARSMNDSGLRFIESENNTFLCPECGAAVKEGHCG